MNDLNCMIQGCQAKVYSPAGTQHVCKEHFLSFLTWRRRKGPQMFIHYAGLTMEQRDSIAAEWSKTVSIVEAPTGSAPKSETRLSRLSRLDILPPPDRLGGVNTRETRARLVHPITGLP